MKRDFLNIWTILLFSPLIGCDKDNLSQEEKFQCQISKIDLNDPKLTFEEVKETLLYSSDLNVQFSDYERTLHDVEIDKNVVLEDGVMLKCENDSVSFAITQSYISIISNINPNREDKILIHRDQEYIREYYRNTVLPMTRSVNDSSNLQVNIHPNGVLSISGGWNIQREKAHAEPSDVRTAESASSQSVVHSGRYRDALRIWLIRHKGYAGSHEVTWQQQDVRRMIHKINPTVKIEFYTRGSNFHATNDAYKTLDNFDKWLYENRNSGYDWSEFVDQDIFILISYGTYKDIAGIAYESSYFISRKYNFQAVGLSAINPLTANKTLAHEIGHILGAKHTNYAWKEGWWIFKIWIHDVMSYKWPRSAWTLEPDNMRAVRNATTF